MLLETVLRSLSRKEPHHHVLSRSRNAIRSGSDGSGSKLNVQHKMAQSVTVFFFTLPIHILNHFNYTEIRGRSATTIRLAFVCFQKSWLVI
jgi:hypothetical protein